MLDLLDIEKDKVAISKGYDNWESMINWIARDGEHPIVVAQLVEHAMQEVVLSIQNSKGEKI